MQEGRQLCASSPPTQFKATSPARIDKLFVVLGDLISLANSDCVRTRRNRPEFMQQALKSLSRTARAWVASAEFFHQFLVAVDKAQTAFDARLGWEALTPLGRDLESRGGR